MKRIGGVILTLALTLAASPLMAQEAVPEPHSAGLPQFNPHWFPSEVLWLAICFVAMYAISSVLLLPAIGGTLEARAKRIENDLSSAEQMKNEAEAAREKFEAGLDEARAEAGRIVQAVHDSLKAKADSNAAAFRETMEREITALEARLAKARSAAMEDMNTIAAEVANEAARKIVGLDLDPKKAHSVVKALTREAA